MDEIQNSKFKIQNSSDWLAFLLQTSDPLFPTGAYAHSLGLEEIVRLNIVRDEASLLDFLQQQILPALEQLELPFVRLAYEAARNENVDALCDLDREISAWKICHELREASIQLGTRRLQMLLKIFPQTLFSQFHARQLAGDAAGHHIAVFAMQSAAQNVPLRAALTAYFYQSLAGLCSAALKLIRIGQEGCQRVLRECLTTADSCVENSLEVSRGEAGWFNPVLEIAAMRHETAYERLFIS
jgi:urease accessory protein